MKDIIIKDKQFYLKLLSIGLPIVLQSVITTGVNMADNIMLGKLGEVQMSGATLANQFISLFQICCMGIGMGASVLTSRFWGMKNIQSLKKAVVLMIRLTIALSLIFTLVTIPFSRNIMYIFTDVPEVVEQGVRYFNISAYIYILTGLTITISLTLRSVGRAIVPLEASIIAFFANIFFNWMFIFGNLGAPRMEVQGAALGTLLARLFECGTILIYFFVKDRNIQMKIRDLFMSCSDLLKEYIRICFPVLVSDTLLGLGNSAVSIVTGHIGAAFVAAVSITTVVQQVSTVVIQGMSQSSCIMIGNTLGEGDVKKAQKQGYTFWLLGAAFGVLGCMIILLIKNPVIGFYNVEESTKALANELMLAVAVVIVFQCMNSMLTKGVLRGGGDTKFLMVADILFLWCLSIPAGALAGLVLKLPGFWIYICLKLDQIIKAIWCIFRLHSGKWIKKIQPVS